MMLRLITTTAATATMMMMMMKKNKWFLCCAARPALAAVWFVHCARSLAYRPPPIGRKWTGRMLSGSRQPETKIEPDQRRRPALCRPRRHFYFRLVPAPSRESYGASSLLWDERRARTPTSERREAEKTDRSSSGEMRA
jgi:hypothetical protein